MELRVTANVIYETYFRCYASCTNCLWWCKFPRLFLSDLLTPNPVGKTDVIYLWFSPRDFFLWYLFLLFRLTLYQTSANQNTSETNRQFTLSSSQPSPFPFALLSLLSRPPRLYPKVDAVLSHPAVNHVSGWSTLETVSNPSLIGWQSVFPCGLPPVPLTYKQMPQQKKPLLSNRVMYVYYVGKPPCLLIKLK